MSVRRRRARAVVAAFGLCAAPLLVGAAADGPPSRAVLKGRIGETALDMAGQCRIARKGRPFLFWSDGGDEPALGDANRDGWYLVVAVTQQAADAAPIASVVFRHQGRVVFDDARSSAFTLSGNTLSVDTQAQPVDGEAPILLRLAIVCGTR
jgi:hypothetical protein